MPRVSRMQLRATEAQEQQAVVQWADHTVVEVTRDRFHSLGRFLYAVPNGEVLNSGLFGARQRMARIARLRAVGFRSGILDLVLDLPRGPYHGARLEMKRRGERPSDAQRACIATFREAGYHADWRDNADDAIAWLKAYLELGLFDSAAWRSGSAPGGHRPEVAGSIPAAATLDTMSIHQEVSDA